MNFENEKLSEWRHVALSVLLVAEGLDSLILTYPKYTRKLVDKNEDVRILLMRNNKDAAHLSVAIVRTRFYHSRSVRIEH